MRGDTEIFSRGDVVRLVSGGPRMVVYKQVFWQERKWWDATLPEIPGVYVEWIAVTGTPHKQVYAPEVLVRDCYSAKPE